ncbi:hypothetical protein ZWY2020_005501 [Hordeum vulgare]|nr:hypothetical protein ZWY2020_005501 [Hordeum vulgare]
MDFGMEGESGKQQQLPRFLPCGSDIQSSDQHIIELKVDKQKQTEVENDKQKLMTEVKMDKQKQTTKLEMDMRKQMTEVELDDMDVGKSVKELTMEKEEMAAEEEDFARYKRAWQSSWITKGCGFFEDTTQLSSMHFTHLTPKPSLDDAIVAETLQILSIKLTEIKGGFKLPLSVYGVVAARDSVDHNRNLLFAHSRITPQRIRQHNPYLRLIGPSRAILCRDPVRFEIQLKVERGTVSRDRALISATHDFYARQPGVHTICFENRFCKIELCLERLVETIQATICSVRVVKQGTRQRVERQCQVSCSTTSYSRKIVDGKPTYVANAPSGEVVLLDRFKRAMPSGSEGYLDLSRRVVSVEREGSLKVVVQTCSSSGDITAEGHVSLASKYFGFSQKEFNVGDAELEITVAWSLLVVDQDDIVRPEGRKEKKDLESSKLQEKYDMVKNLAAAQVGVIRNMKRKLAEERKNL